MSAAAPPLRQRAAAAVRAFALRVALAITDPFRRAAAAVDRAWDRRDTKGREAAWYRRALHSLSMQRAKPLPSAAPSGADAREMPWEQYQDHPGYGITLERIVAVFRQAEAGYPREQCDLFDDLIETDCTLRSLFTQRSQAVAGKPFVIEKGGSGPDDELAARVLQYALDRIPMIPFFAHQLSANKYGWGASEIDWGVLEFEGRPWVVPVWLANVPARRFAIDILTDSLRLRTQANPSRGEELRPGKWVITKGPDSDRFARAGLMRSAAFFCSYKRFGVRDWVIYSNKFGLPLVLVSYDDRSAGSFDGKGATDDPTRAICREIVENIGSDGGAVVPESVKVDIKEASRNADASNTHGKLIEFCNAENAKLVIGATLTGDNAGSGGASYALGQVHATVRWGLIEADAALLAESFKTQLATAFVQFNGLAASPPKLVMQVVQDLTPLTRVQIADFFVNKLGGKLSASQLGTDLCFRAPLDESDRLPGAPTAAPAGNAEPNASPLKVVA